MKITQVDPMLRVSAYVVAIAFCNSWVFKYGVLDKLLSDNGPQFS